MYFSPYSRAGQVEGPWILQKEELSVMGEILCRLESHMSGQPEGSARVKTVRKENAEYTVFQRSWLLSCLFLPCILSLFSF